MTPEMLSRMRTAAISGLAVRDEFAGDLFLAAERLGMRVAIRPLAGVDCVFLPAVGGGYAGTLLSAATDEPMRTQLLAVALGHHHMCSPSAFAVGRRYREHDPAWCEEPWTCLAFGMLACGRSVEFRCHVYAMHSERWGWGYQCLHRHHDDDLLEAELRTYAQRRGLKAAFAG